MKIAATYENALICKHFAETKQFKIYTVENERITTMEVVSVNGEGEDANICFLKEQGVGILICGSISSSANIQLMASGIAVFAGAAGEADMEVAILTTSMFTQVSEQNSEQQTEERMCDSTTCDKTSCVGCTGCSSCGE